MPSIIRVHEGRAWRGNAAATRWPVGRFLPECGFRSGLNFDGIPLSKPRRVPRRPPYLKDFPMFKYAFALAATFVCAGLLPSLATADDASEQKVRDAIKSMAPAAKIDSIADSNLPGFYEVVMGGNVLYVTGDGKYLIQGRVYDVGSKRDLTEAREAVLRKVKVDAVGADQRIIFAAKNPKHKVTVFTDIDCGYCRKLHQEMAQYNDLGISIEYLFFPRAGIGSPSFDHAVSVWCAEDRNKALTDAKAGTQLEKKSCSNPITNAYQLGQEVGVTGTPAVIAEDGTMIGGYVPPAGMLERLNTLKAKSSP
jgi:thiol:disulfide interchange protein DsbC